MGWDLLSLKPDLVVRKSVHEESIHCAFNLPNERWRNSCLWNEKEWWKKVYGVSRVWVNGFRIRTVGGWKLEWDKADDYNSVAEDFARTMKWSVVTLNTSRMNVKKTVSTYLVLVVKLLNIKGEIQEDMNPGRGKWWINMKQRWPFKQKSNNCICLHL